MSPSATALRSSRKVLVFPVVGLRASLDQNLKQGSQFTTPRFIDTLTNAGILTDADV